MQSNRIGRIGRAALVLAAVGFLALRAVAQFPGGGGGDTNAVATNFVAQPFPLNLIPTSLQADAPAVNLSSWADLDGAVAAGYNRLTNSMMLFPPGNLRFVFDAGLFSFSTNGELAANLDLFQATSATNVSLWKMGAIETNLAAARSWVYFGGANDGANNFPFRTNAVPSGFDSQAWVRSLYGNPPSYLACNQTLLAQWYADRFRERVLLGMTLIKSNDLATLQTALQAANANATNAPGVASVPQLPADTNY